MAWFSGKVSLGNFPDLTGAVNKLSESVKNIEKTFDNALGLEGKSDAGSSGSEASGLWPSAAERKTLFEPIMGFVGQKGGETVEMSEELKSSKPSSLVSDEQIESGNSTKTEISEQIPYHEEAIEKLKGTEIETTSKEAIKDAGVIPKHNVVAAERGEELVSPAAPVDETEQKDFEPVKPINSLKKEELTENVSPASSESGQLESAEKLQQEERPRNISPIELEPVESESTSTLGSPASVIDDSNSSPDSLDKQNTQKEDTKELFSLQAPEEPPEGLTDGKETSNSDICDVSGNDKYISADKLPVVQHNDVDPTKAASDLVAPLTDTFAESMELKQQFEEDSDVREQRSSTGSNSPAHSVAELEKVKKEMKIMETALQGAARQAQAKADEIAKLMNENEQLKAVIDDLRRKTTEADIESLREEYHQKVASLERKLYTLTKERDTLRREQNKKSDAAALLKEKDEIITQVMAEGEQLSKKQAAQESHIRKLRAQIRELEEEKKGLLTKLQVEENKVDSLKRDKAATEKLLQDTVEKHQAEITTQKEHYTNALNAAKEAEAIAEARANTEARTELESRLREVEDRESMLVQTIEELRQTLSRKEQQAVFREDTHRREIEDLQRRYQMSERRCEELITQVPESTRPLLRQIEAMQETAARRAEAWAAVERSLNSRLQEAEAKAATSEEKERSINERLSQTLSRINVLEAQISCLRTEQTQLTRSLEKERQRASENRQEYLALKEEAETHETHANQLENEIRDLRRKHKEELRDMRVHQERLQQELEREKAARLDQEMAIHLQSSAAPDPSPLGRQKSAAFENGNLTRKTSSLSSLPSMEESYFLQSTLDPSESSSDFRTGGEAVMSPYYIKSMTSNTFEAALHQKEGELASYASRLASMESIRDSLAEELVNMTAECEKLRTEAATLPGIRAELEALRRRHSAALELMGERDEELEELRNDIVDLKEMYKEQVNLLVNKSSFKQSVQQIGLLWWSRKSS